MKARGLLFGLLLYILFLSFGIVLPSCTIKESTDEKVIKDGLKTETERLENVEIDMDPSQMHRSIITKVM